MFVRFARSMYVFHLYMSGNRPFSAGCGCRVYPWRMFLNPFVRLVRRSGIRPRSWRRELPGTMAERLRRRSATTRPTPAAERVRFPSARDECFMLSSLLLLAATAVLAAPNPAKKHRPYHQPSWGLLHQLQAYTNPTIGTQPSRPMDPDCHLIRRIGSTLWNRHPSQSLQL